MESELERLIQLLEAEIPANPAAEKNERLEGQLQRSLAEYFKGMDQAMDWGKVEVIYLRNVKI